MNVKYNYDQQLAGLDINHLATAILHPDAYFNNRICTFVCGPCYLIRRDRETYKYSSCNVDQFISEFNKKDNIISPPTRIKELNGAYHLVSLSLIGDMIDKL